MPTPILIDTDMGVDDAVAIALALASKALDCRALISTGGNVDLQQATDNIGRMLAAVRPAVMPLVARGLDQSAGGLSDARHVFGRDGLGECGLPAAEMSPLPFAEAYRRALDDTGSLDIVAIGPLTTLAAMLRDDAPLLRKARRITIMGGALWCKGNINGKVEFNFYRDPAATAAVLSSGLPITLVPLDVTQFVTLDESHLARLSASETRTGTFLAQVMPYPMQHSNEAGRGRFIVHDALAIGAILWPDLFLKTRLVVEVETSGQYAGRTRPRVSRGDEPTIDVLTAVNAVDFLENMLESLCQESEFVV